MISIHDANFFDGIENGYNDYLKRINVARFVKLADPMLVKVISAIIVH